jgi:hypothetical protein
VIANFSEEQLTLPKGTILGVAQEVVENAVFTVDDEEETNRGQDQIFYSGEQEEVPQWFRKYLNEKLAHLSSDEKEIIEPVLIQYAEIFHNEENNDFKSTKIIEHRIETEDSPPIKKAPYKVPFALRQEMNRQVQTMFDKGVIRPSHSPWSSPVVLVKKKIRGRKPEISFLC